jgi:hypothetical protein
MSLTATLFPTTVARYVGNAEKTVQKTFLAAASTSYSAGDLVTIATDGSVVKNATDGAEIDGVVAANVDNSVGALGDKFVPVTVKGNVWVDGFIDISGGTYDDAFAIGSQCGASGDGGTTVSEGQAISATAALTSKQFTSLVVQALPTGVAKKYRTLAFFQGSGKFA